VEMGITRSNLAKKDKYSENSLDAGKFLTLVNLSLEFHSG
jgi:hypothetical protein